MSNPQNARMRQVIITQDKTTTSSYCFNPVSYILFHHGKTVNEFANQTNQPNHRENIFVKQEIDLSTISHHQLGLCASKQKSFPALTKLSLKERGRKLVDFHKKSLCFKQNSLIASGDHRLHFFLDINQKLMEMWSGEVDSKFQPIPYRIFKLSCFAPLVGVSLLKVSLIKFY